MHLKNLVPVEDIVIDDYKVDFKHTVKTSAAEITLPDNLESMMEEKVISLYQSSFGSVNGEYEVRLQTLPYSAELISLFCLPYISRAKVKQDLALRKFYRIMLEKPSAARTPDLIKLEKDNLDAGKIEYTVIAQVLVWCQEIFYVKDVSNGKIIQGVVNDSPRNVPHLVRMEMTVNKEKHNGQFSNQKDFWIITEIDDLLEGNLIV